MSPDLGAQLMTDLAQSSAAGTLPAETPPTVEPSAEDPTVPPFDRISMDDAGLAENGGFGLIVGDARGTSFRRLAKRSGVHLRILQSTK